MIELITNPFSHISLWLFVSFYILACSTVAMTLFVFHRKYPALINGLVLYSLFFVAFSRFLIKFDEIIGALRAVHEPEKLPANTAVMLVILALALMILGSLSLVQSSKGYKAARADIAASASSS